MTVQHQITTIDELAAIYGEPRPQSVLKEVGSLTPEYRAWVEASPFLVLASAGPGGLDCTPRGEAGGAVRVLDDSTLLLPDWPGNNRIDTLRNVVHDPRVAMLFLVPSREEAIRVNGRAVISVDADLLAHCALASRQPVTVLVVTIDSVYFQCARALKRSGLWSTSSGSTPPDLPSIGQMLAAITRGTIDGASYDAELAERLNKSLF